MICIAGLHRVRGVRRCGGRAAEAELRKLPKRFQMHVQRTIFRGRCLVKDMIQAFMNQDAHFPPIYKRTTSARSITTLYTQMRGCHFE
jgi:hypothetical protein